MAVIGKKVSGSTTLCWNLQFFVVGKTNKKSFVANYDWEISFRFTKFLLRRFHNISSVGKNDFTFS